MELHSARHENVCVYSYTTCVILAVIALAISIGIGAYFTCSRWYLKKMLLILSLALVLNRIEFSKATIKQQFNELINGKIKKNRDEKSNLLFLQRHN